MSILVCFEKNIYFSFQKSIMVQVFWEVESLEDFLYYCCPECDQKYQTCDDFQKHALSDHPKGIN